MSDEPLKFLSTSRLAKALAVDGKALFSLLSEQGWIEHVDDQWRLTAQGEFHGGQYQHSDKYGDYVVWPESVVESPVLLKLEGLMVSATKLAELFGSSAATMNLLLAHLGWIEKDQRGWMLTDLGSRLGGEAHSSKQGFFVLWPAAIRQQPLFQKALKRLLAEDGPSLDGFTCRNVLQQKVCNWLYLHGLVNAKDHALPGQEFLTADFYLPQRQVYIDCWDVNDSDIPLSVKMEKHAYYQQMGLKHVELSTDDAKHLDDVIAQKLLRFGVQ